MISVLHVTSGLDTGGAETSLVELACALSRRGMLQHVVSVGGEGAYGDELRRGGVGLTALHVASGLGAPLGLLRLTRLVQALRPDAINGWMYHGNLMAALAHRLTPRRDGPQLYWNVRASNVDDERYAGLVRWTARLSGWPDTVIYNSHAGAEFHRGKGYRSHREEVIANGIDTDRFRPDSAARAALRAELGIAPDAVVAIHAARVDPMKNHRGFLAAIDAVPHVIGLMAGLRTETLPCPPNVRALGLRRDLDRLYCAADIVVSTSIFAEGFSNAIAEGMSAGLIPVATDVGDARLVVGDTGPIVRPGHVSELTDAIAKLAALRFAERKRRGTLARARVVENFTIQKSVESFARLFSAVPA